MQVPSVRLLNALAIAMAVASVAAVLARPSGAELPPQAYHDMQEEAAEVIVLTVERVETSNDGRSTGVVATARVDHVVRSASGLARGTEIRLEYRSVALPDGMVGPRPIPVVEEGASYRAWLFRAHDGKSYGPAARGASFSRERTP